MARFIARVKTMSNDTKIENLTEIDFSDPEQAIKFIREHIKTELAQKWLVQILKESQDPTIQAAAKAYAEFDNLLKEVASYRVRNPSKKLLNSLSKQKDEAVQSLKTIKVTTENCNTITRFSYVCQGLNRRNHDLDEAGGYVTNKIIEVTGQNREQGFQDIETAAAELEKAVIKLKQTPIPTEGVPTPPEVIIEVKASISPLLDDYEATIKDKTTAMQIKVTQLTALANQSLKNYSSMIQALNLDSKEVIQAPWQAPKALVTNHARQLLDSPELKAIRDEINRINTPQKLQQKITEILTASRNLLENDFVPSYVFYQKIESQLSIDSKKMWNDRFKNISTTEYVGSFFSTEEIDHRILSTILQNELTSRLGQLSQHIATIDTLSDSLKEVQTLRDEQAQKIAEEAKRELKLPEQTPAPLTPSSKIKQFQEIVAALNNTTLTNLAMRYQHMEDINSVTELLRTLNTLREVAQSSPKINQRFFIGATSAVAALLDKPDPTKQQLLIQVLIAASSAATQERISKNFLSHFATTIKQAKESGCINDTFNLELTDLLKKAQAQQEEISPKANVVTSLTKGINTLFKRTRTNKTLKEKEIKIDAISAEKKNQPL